MQGTKSSEGGWGIDRFFKDTSPHTALLIQNVGDWGEEIARQMKTNGTTENTSKDWACNLGIGSGKDISRFLTLHYCKTWDKISTLLYKGY